MKTSTFAVLSFAGLICLAASILWFPLPQYSGSIPAGASAPATVASGDDSTSQPVPNEVPTSESTDSTGAETSVATSDPSLSLQFPTWPRPAAALVITGEQHGYFEPCGCTANQLGGMSRRANLIAKVRALGWEVRGVDLGGISKRTGLQAQMKFETTLAALRELQYVGVGMGVEELKLGPDDLPLKFLAANLVFFGSPDLGTPLPYTIVDVNGVKVGITSVMSVTVRKDAIPDMTAEETTAADMSFINQTEALTKVLKDFDDAKVAFRVVISHSTLDESRQLALAFPTINVVLAADGFGDGEVKPELIGTVRMLQVGEKGRAAGVLGIYPSDVEAPVRFELVTLNDRVADEAPAITSLMQQYQDRLKEQSVVTSSDAAAHPSGASFVGAAKCGECHTQAYAIWKNTPHAHGFESLDPSFQRKGHERLHGVGRTFDPECLACHVTGWNPETYVRFQSGFLNQEFAAADDEKLLQSLLGGNQCENCHGPGSRHVELIESGDTTAAASLMRITLDQARETTCVSCHDADNSPNFKFEQYWDQVKHYGKD